MSSTEDTTKINSAPPPSILVSKTATLDGGFVELYSDGKKIFTTKDNVIIVQNAKGQIIKQTNPDGTIIEVNDESDPDIVWLEKHTKPDGTELESYKGGVLIQRNPNGSSITKHPGGITEYDPETGDTRHKFVDGYEMHELADGTTIEVSPNGERKQANEDGTTVLIIHQDGSKTITKNGKEHFIPNPTATS